MDEEANGESTFITGGDHSAALSDVTSILSQPREERLANLERFTRCITCKFCRRPAQEDTPAQAVGGAGHEDLDLRKLMPDSLGRDPDVWEYTSCAICLCDFADGEELRRASCPGGHAFHPKCLRAWIERSNETCPVCRCKEGDRSKTGSGARFSADALAEFVTRRMRSTKVDFTVSKENHQRADEVMAQLFLPMVCLKPAVEEEDEPQAPSPQKAATKARRRVDRSIWLGLLRPLMTSRCAAQGSTLVEIFAARNAARQAERPPGVASPRKSPRRGAVLRCAMATRAMLSAKTYTASMSALAQKLAWREVIALFASMKEQSIQADAYSFSVVSSACEKASQWSLALDTFIQMRTEGLVPNVVNFAGAMSACGRAARWRMALSLMKELPGLQLEADAAVYNSLISACSRASEWRESLRLFKRMERGLGPKPTLVTYGALASALEKGEQWPEALLLLEQLPEPRTVKGHASLVIAFNTVISACEKAWRWPFALQVFQRMEEKKLKPTTITWNALLSAIRRAESWQTSLHLFRQMQAEDVTPILHTYNISISSCHTVDAWPYALALMEEARQCGHLAEALQLLRSLVEAGVCQVWKPTERFTADLHGFTTDEAAVVVMLAIFEMIEGAHVTPATGPAVGADASSDLVLITGRRRAIWTPGQRSPPLAAKRRSGPVQAVHSPPSQSRVPRGATASPLNSPPVGGATTSVRVFQDHIPNARSAGSLVGNVPPLDRRRKEDLSHTGRQDDAPDAQEDAAHGFAAELLGQRCRTLPAEVPPVDLKLRRSASGSLMEGVSDSRANASGAYPVVKPPLSATRSGAESATTGTFTSFSGSTTPLTEGGEGVPSTLLSRLRNNPVLQVQDSRIMQLIGKRTWSVLKTGQAGRSKARSTPSDDKEELDTEEVVETVETTPFAPGDRPRKRASHAAGASQAPPGVDPQEELQRKVTNHDSPRNCVADHVAVMDDSADSAIVWPGMPKEEECFSVSVPVQTPPAAVASVAPAPAQPAPEHAARIPTPHVLLQNEAGSLVVPQTWRFARVLVDRWTP
eukprot:g19084.t1